MSKHHLQLRLITTFSSLWASPLSYSNCALSVLSECSLNAPLMLPECSWSESELERWRLRAFGKLELKEHIKGQTLAFLKSKIDILSIVQCWHSQGVHSVTQQPQPQHGSACVGLYSNIRQEHSECKYKLYKQQKIRKLLLQNWVWNPLIQDANIVTKTFLYNIRKFKI